jgi:hypothetical protein
MEEADLRVEVTVRSKSAIFLIERTVDERVEIACTGGRGRTERRWPASSFWTGLSAGRGGLSGVADRVLGGGDDLGLA